jgi:hypothetical protein
MELMIEMDFLTNSYAKIKIQTKIYSFLYMPYFFFYYNLINNLNINVVVVVARLLFMKRLCWNFGYKKIVTCFSDTMQLM